MIASTMMLSVAAVAAAAIPGAPAAPERPDAPAPSASVKALFDFVRPGEGWTAAGIAAAAVERSPRVASARARLEAAEAGAESARAALLPRTSLSARYTRLSAIDNDPLVALSIDLDQARAGTAQIQDPAARAVLGAQLDQLGGLADARIEIPQNQVGLSARVAYPVSQLFFEILPAVRARDATTEAAREEADVARNVVALEAVEAFLGHARARSAFAVAQLAVAQAKTNVEAASARIVAKSGTRPDLLRFQARLADAERAEAERRADVIASAARVRTLVGLEGDGPLDAGEALTEAPRAPVGFGAGADLVARAWRERDELQAVGRLIAAREAASSAAGGGVWPKLVASAQLDHANPNALYTPPGDRFRTSWSVSGVLEWSPDEAWRASREAKAADAQVREGLGQRDALRDLVRIEVSSAAARYQAAVVALSASRRGLEAAEAGYAAVRRGYELGVFDATDLIDAELQLERARLGLIDAGVEIRVRQARLRRSVGEHLWEPA